MVAGIAASAFDRLVFRARPAGRRAMPPYPPQPAGDDHIRSRGQDRQQPRQVVAVPVPGLECFPEADQAARAQPLVKRLGPPQQQGRLASAAAAGGA